jgi:hypothetical protein
MWFTSDEYQCRGTLIRHADGTDECEHLRHCGGDELLHAHVVACHELACACAGEAWPLAEAA